MFRMTMVEISEFGVTIRNRVLMFKRDLERY